MRRQRMSLILVVSGIMLLAFGFFTPARTSQAAQGDIPTRPPAPSATPIQVPPTEEPTAAPATAEPPTATAEPPTPEPPTATAEPPTPEPPTPEPATAEPPTAEPATAVPTQRPPAPTRAPAVGGVRDTRSPLPVTATAPTYNWTWIALGSTLVLAGVALWMLRRRRARPAMEDYDFWLDRE